MTHTKMLSQQPELRFDHIVVVVAGELCPQSVTWLARAAVADPIGEDDEELGGVEGLAGSVELVRELRGKELAAAAPGSVQDQHGVGGAAAGVATQLAEREVVDAKLGQRLARAEFEVT